MNQIQLQMNSFEQIKHMDENGNEYWLARELMPMLEYVEWRNFSKVVRKAKKSFGKTYQQVNDHFVEINKTIAVAPGTSKQTTRKVRDYKLTRRACYIIAQNGDSSKEAIALAQNYFAEQTRKREVEAERKEFEKRLQAREKLKETEKKLSSTLMEHQVESQEIGHIRSAGDATLFGLKTKDMKRKLGVPDDKPLADHLPTISLKAKDFAAEMTTHQTKQKRLTGKEPIISEHVHNNREIRKLLTSNGIFPEELPAEEDINKLRTKYPEKDDALVGRDADDEHFLSMTNFSVDITGISDKDFIEKLHETIESAPGESEMKIYYGSSDKPKMVRRSVELTQELLGLVRDYLIY
ncbi:DNA damage-inducible protein D [Candidatus Dojkabacteria bacterium]|nr:DNA damage-inducible protein D [Candidatus Dojkabacteria bacterium]